jgi:hypothetical protein
VTVNQIGDWLKNQPPDWITATAAFKGDNSLAQQDDISNIDAVLPMP